MGHSVGSGAIIGVEPQDVDVGGGGDILCAGP